jgi:CheY-like chemotaxis protein
MIILDPEAPPEIGGGPPWRREIGLLVVEDQTTIRRSFATRLRDQGFFVRVARSGKQAVQFASYPDVDIILLDIEMPGQYDGIDAAHQIHEAYPDKEIVFVTAHSDREEYRRRARQWGLQDIEWVTKPSTGWELTALLDTIHRIARKVEMRKIRGVLEIGESRGIRRREVLKVLQIVDPGITDDLVQDLLGDTAQKRSALIEELRASLRKVSFILMQTPPDIQAIQIAFAPFKETVLGGRFWSLYEESEQNRQRIAVKLRSAVRKLSSMDVEDKHISALSHVIDKLAQDQIAEDDVYECERFLRFQGIETLLDLGRHREEMLEIYRQVSDEGDEEER